MNKLPEYVIEELIPRFSGINSMVLASIKADKYNKLIKTHEQVINGHYIIYKESQYNADYLFLSFDKHDSPYAIITLLSKQTFDNIKKFKEKKIYCDYTGNLLYGCIYNAYQIYVTPDGFANYFNIKTLESEIGIEYVKHYSFDTNKLKVNYGYEIKNSIVSKIIQYGILNSVSPEHLDFTMIEQGDVLGEYKLQIEDVVNGTIEINPVDL